MTQTIKNILEKVIYFMEMAEEMDEIKGKGDLKKEYVFTKMRKNMGQNFLSYKYEIETLIESVIFISKLGDLYINKKKKIKGNCFGF